MATNEQTKIISRNILLLSYEKGITQKELAEAAGISGQMLSKVMKGKRPMPDKRIPPIAARLGVSVHELTKDKKR